jgi:Family of unknown function (DUF6573)
MTQIHSIKQSDDDQSFWGEVIHSYTRAEAIEDGVLIDVSRTAKEAGFKWPTAITNAAWQDCVAWTDADNARQTFQDQTGRLWDVLWMAITAIRKSAQSGQVLYYEIDRVPRDGKSFRAEQRQLKLVCGPGDHGEPVITIMLPDEG